MKLEDYQGLVYLQHLIQNMLWKKEIKAKAFSGTSNYEYKFLVNYLVFKEQRVRKYLSHAIYIHVKTRQNIVLFLWLLVTPYTY